MRSSNNVAKIRLFRILSINGKYFHISFSSRHMGSKTCIERDGWYPGHENFCKTIPAIVTLVELPELTGKYNNPSPFHMNKHIPVLPADAFTIGPHDRFTCLPLYSRISLPVAAICINWMFDVWGLMFDVWCLRFEVWCQCPKTSRTQIWDLPAKPTILTGWAIPKRKWNSRCVNARSALFLFLFLLCGGDRSRTGVQTWFSKAFYMLISELLVGKQPELNKPIESLAGWS